MCRAKNTCGIRGGSLNSTAVAIVFSLSFKSLELSPAHFHPSFLSYVLEEYLCLPRGTALPDIFVYDWFRCKIAECDREFRSMDELDKLPQHNDRMMGETRQTNSNGRTWWLYLNSLSFLRRF